MTPTNLFDGTHFEISKDFWKIPDIKWEVTFSFDGWWCLNGETVYFKKGEIVEWKDGAVIRRDIA